MDNKFESVMDATLQLVSDLRQENLTLLEEIATRTIGLVESIFNDESWKTAEELLIFIKAQMRSISEIVPQHTIPINILRHMLKVVREEHDSKFKSKGEEESLHNLAKADSEACSGDYSLPSETLRPSLLDHLAEYKVEIESSMDNIVAQALEHIHDKEIIFTLGNSKLVEKFLKTAAQTRTFQVICMEGAPEFDGVELARSLGKSNIKTTVISDAAVFAIMSRVNKVIMPTNAVMADGTLNARNGTYTVGRCAKHYSVPVIVLTHLYQLSSKYTFPYNPDPRSVTVNPEKVLPLSEGSILSRVRVINPPFDKMPPDFVTLFITHNGGNAPSYLYRLRSELYHQDDRDL